MQVSVGLAGWMLVDVHLGHGQKSLCCRGA